MASIQTPRSMSRGTKYNPEGNNVEVNSMSLRSGKRKITVNAEDVSTPQKENVMKRRKSNRVDFLKGATPTSLGLIKTDENLATPTRKSMKNGSTSTLSNSFTSLTPKLKDITQSVQNKLTKDFTPKPLETNENASGSSRKSMKKNNTHVIKKSFGLQNDSVIAITPNSNNVTKAAKSMRGKKKNAVHPGDVAGISMANTSSATQNEADNSCAMATCSESVIILSPELPQSCNSKQNILNNLEAKENEIEMKQFLKHGTIIDSDSFTAPGSSRTHMNNSIDSFVLEPLPEDSSQLLETSSDPEISMNLNTTYDLEENVTHNVTSNALSTRKSVHFKQTPEILGPRRRSNSVSNISVEIISNNTAENIKQRISTPAARRRAGSTPVPARKNGSSATKLPDFSLIHQRNFEKMESIYDYHHRRKGSSQKKVPPVAQERKLPGSTSVMVFKAKSSNPLPTTSKIPVVFKPISRSTPAKPSRSTPAKPSYSEAKEAIMRKTPVNKTPTQSVDLVHSAAVENNRNILKGVRLNRRFELQMKHRNMKL